MEKTIKSELIYGGKKLRLYRDEVELPSGGKALREVVEHPGSVAMVPIIKEGEVLLIRQYRYAVKGYLYEIPAGTLEEGETPEQCAIREMEEETGYLPQRLEKLGQFYPSPGVMNELMHLYKVSQLVRKKPESVVSPPEESIEQVVILHLSKALDMIRRGEIIDGKTICGLLWVAYGKPTLEQCLQETE
ncbi:MAG TPA: NUDIX hydrolase [Candidatus Hypogeohydataceae bacterium YC41]